jgi:DedD protein
MDIKTKHRVIGIIVIIALAVILVPLIFTRSSHDKTPSLSSDMPTAPGTAGQTPLAIQPQSSNTTPDAINNAALTPPTSDNSAASNPADADNSADDSAAAAAMTSLSSAAAASPTATTTAIAATSAATATAAASSTAAQPAAEQQKVTVAKKSAVKTRLVEHHAHHTAHHKKTYAHAKSHSAKAVAMPEAWIIQLASFSEKSHAEKLVTKLREKGFAAYVHEARAENNLLARVYVGPELNKEKAERVLKKLHEEFRMEGEVIKYKA